MLFVCLKLKVLGFCISYPGCKCYGDCTFNILNDFPTFLLMFFFTKYYTKLYFDCKRHLMTGKVLAKVRELMLLS